MKGLALVLLAGCNSLLGVHDFATGDDVTTDGNGMYCYGSTDATRVCLADAPNVPRIFNGQIDTSPANPDCLAAISAPPGCVLAYTQIDIDKLRAIGSRPLILVSTSTLEVIAGGMLDLSSHRGDPGAGARELGDPDGDGIDNDPGCVTPNTTVGRGGPGGSLGGRGGPGGGPIAPNDPHTVTQPIGGCPGTSGALIASATGGAGGGAVLLIAADVTIAGTVNASGGGGAGATLGGGGGGGAGGSIFIDAGVVHGSGILVANGGGGGTGCSGMLPVSVYPGEDPDATRPLARAVGGMGLGMLAAGGDGAAGTGVDGLGGAVETLTQQTIGGGGGGGAGVIVLTSGAPFTGTRSP